MRGHHKLKTKSYRALCRGYVWLFEVCIYIYICVYILVLVRIYRNGNENRRVSVLGFKVYGLGYLENRNCYSMLRIIGEQGGHDRESNPRLEALGDHEVVTQPP